LTGTPRAGTIARGGAGRDEMGEPMDPPNLIADERHAAFCVFCGDVPTTREHAASRVLLDDTLPDDLPLVGSCFRCNNGFSRDEEYLACLIDCVIRGTAEPEKVKRPKVRASLLHSPALAARIAAARTEDPSGRLIWKPEEERVCSVIVKLARGHVAHQYSEPQFDDPTSVMVMPLEVMTDEQREEFETVPASELYPEIGSRAFMNMFVVGDEVLSADDGWTVLQEGRYRYAVALPEQPTVRIVLSEYLAAEVVW
jgi:hypothetical protein